MAGDLSDFLRDLLEVFEGSPDGLVIDADLCGAFREGLIDALRTADVLERSAALTLAARPPEPYLRALDIQARRRAIVAADQSGTVQLLPEAIRTAVPIGA
jgi:hypothetical protein